VLRLLTAAARTAHFDQTDHPVVCSAEPNEEWRWCFVDSRLGWDPGWIGGA
jgi:hypothetical protein